MKKILLYALFATCLCSCSRSLERSNSVSEPIPDYIIDSTEYNKDEPNLLDSSSNTSPSNFKSQTVSKPKNRDVRDLSNDPTLFPAIVNKSQIKYDQYKNGTFELTILNQSTKKIRSIELTITNRSKSSFSKHNIYVDRSKMDKVLPMITDLDLAPNYQKMFEIPIKWNVDVFSEPYITWVSFNDGTHWSISDI